MSIIDDITEGLAAVANGGVGRLKGRPGERVAFVLGYELEDDVETAIVVLDVTGDERGPIVHMYAFKPNGEPADLARLEWSAGSVMYHVLP
jgi:hypothetical protein